MTQHTLSHNETLAVKVSCEKPTALKSQLRCIAGGLTIKYRNMLQHRKGLRRNDSSVMLFIHSILLKCVTLEMKVGRRKERKEKSLFS